MALKTLWPGFHVIPSGAASMFLLADGDNLVLIDSGYAGSAPLLQEALQQLDRQPSDIRRILVTHLHPDHTGSLSDIKILCGASVAMSAADGDLVAKGVYGRQAKPAPGLLPPLLMRLFIRPEISFPPVNIEESLQDGALLPYAGGLRVIAAPGHTLGQMVFLWEPQGVLICADACMNVFGLDYSILYEDFEKGKETLRHLAELDFDKAVFSHGKPILRKANLAFRRRFA